MPIWSLSDTAKVIFKIALFVTFAAALTAFSIWFIGFMDNIYSVINNATSVGISNNLPPLLGCIINALGIDVYITSMFAIFFSAASFWLTAVGYILAYKLGNKAYDGLFKVSS